jgi:hypothetical protein
MRRVASMPPWPTWPKPRPDAAGAAGEAFLLVDAGQVVGVVVLRDAEDHLWRDNVGGGRRTGFSASSWPGGCRAAAQASASAKMRDASPAQAVL